MNGDGIVDIVKLQRGQVRYWPGRGNGFWGTGHRDDCAAGTFGANRYVEMTTSPTWSDLSGDSLRIDDVNGDGLSDIVQVRFDGVDVWLNVDGVSFTGRHIIANTPASPSYAQRVRLTDINGSGTPDILWAQAQNYKYIDLTGGKRPHLLVGVANGLGKQTSLEYSTSAQEMIAAEAKGTCDPSSPPADIWSKGWCSKMPTVTSVVKLVTETDQLVAAGQGPSTLVTQYEYRDPVYEGRQREFRGFAHARATRIGDQNSPSDVTESSFLLGECTDNDPSDNIDYCSPSERWRDNPNEALKGLPWLTQKRSAAGIYLSTEFTRYRLRELYPGLDGRAVKHAVALGKTDYLYDTSVAQSAGAAVTSTVVDVAKVVPFPGKEEISTADQILVSTKASFTPRAGAVITSSESDVDAFGNQTRATAYGCTGGCEQGADEILTSGTIPKQITENATQWMWRTTESYTTGSAHGGQYKHQKTSYNNFGEPLSVTVTLEGTLALDRHHTTGKPVASAPGTSSIDGPIVVATTTYDEYGNPTRVTGPNGRCGDVNYDLAYHQLPTSEVLYKNGCGNDGLTLGASAYDRGLGKVTIAIDMQGQPTKVAYDAFGRTTALYKPLPNSNAIPAAPSVIIEYFLPPTLGNNISAIHTKTEDGPSIGDGNTLESWSFIDGFGRTRTQLSEADPTADNAQWVVSGLVTHDAKGAARRKYVEYYYTGAPQAFPIASAPTTLYGSQRYDAFGRALQTFDLDGTVTLQTKYHAQSKDLYDAADLEAGPHQDTFATEVTDGHGRVISATERTKVNGQVEQHHILTAYSPVGAPEIITRQRGAGNANDSVTRWMRYDSLGRLVFNADPHTTGGYQSPPGIGTSPSEFAATANSDGSNTPAYAVHAWRYLYNDAGDLVATSDARGCGSNFEYDGVGRLLGEDYSPCEAAHANYSAPNGSPSIESNHGATGDTQAFNNGWEVVYKYDALPSGEFAPQSIKDAYSATPEFWIGRVAAVADRGALSVTQYDGRGRVPKTARRIAKPTVAAFLIPNDLSQRYAPRWYIGATAYDAADRPTHTSVGLKTPELQAARVQDSPIPMGNGDPDFGRSTLVTEYTARGTLRDVLGSYGTLLAGIQRRADGLVEKVTYGDLAATQTVTSYDGRRRPTSIQTFRAAPGVWTTLANGTYSPAPGPDPSGQPTTLQLVLQDLDIDYDIVGNPTEIRDWRDPAEWPVGAKPVTRKIAYDDLYRVRQIKYEYTAGDDTWVSPFAKENGENFTSANFDHRRSMPSPHVKFDKRVLEQDIAYDWLGNTATTDDDAHGFYDRSLGTITNDTAHGKPYQLATANNATRGGNRRGQLETKYDAASNLTDMAVTRGSGSLCLPSGVCNHRFRYDWDEVGRLVRAERWDTLYPDVNDGLPDYAPPTWDLIYAYDASDNRVLKSSAYFEIYEQVWRHSVYASAGQELRGAQFGAAYLDPGTTGGDYEINAKTEVAYLFAHGVRLGRVAYDNGAGMPEFGENAPNPAQHVLINLDDTLGSTSIVIDKATSELVEASSYLAHGATESDYRPDRWKGLREDYRFTGKEEDVEVGLQYFGKRFLSPYLNRWVSADPLAVHSPGKADWNLYAYVHGATLSSVDPIGLEDARVTEDKSVPPPLGDNGKSLVPSADADIGDNTYINGKDAQKYQPGAPTNASEPGEAALKLLGTQANGMAKGAGSTLKLAATWGLCPLCATGSALYQAYQTVRHLPTIAEEAMSDPNVFADMSGQVAGGITAAGVMTNLGSASKVGLQEPTVGADVGWTASKANAPSRGYDRPVLETRSGTAVKDPVNRWNEFLGPKQTNTDPRDGLPDPDRIWSADGQRSIRFGEHEMNSSPSKFHYHEETWTPTQVENVLQRVPQKK